MKSRGVCLLLVVIVVISIEQPLLAEGSLYWLPYSKGIRAFNTQGPYMGNHEYFAIDLKAEYPGYNQWHPAPIAAAETGVLVYYCDRHEKGAEQTNILILGHGEMGNDGQFPEYSWYVHLEKDSVPRELTIGQVVQRGTVIGLEGHNGPSTGIHLHFGVTSFLEPTFLCVAGNSIAQMPESFQLLPGGERKYFYQPFSFHEYHQVEEWPVGNWVGSQNEP